MKNDNSPGFHPVSGPVALLRLALLSAVLVLSACVTSEQTTGGVKASQRDDAKALEYSLQLARGYIASGDWANAQRHLKKALNISPRDAATHEAMAIVMQNTGEYELAEQHFRSALRYQRDFSRARNNFAVFLFDQRRYAEAARELELVVADVLYEKRFSAFANLGRTYKKLHEYEKAEQALLRALGVDRRNIAALLDLAEVQFLLGKEAQSLSYYERYRGLVPQQSPEALWLGVRLAQRFDDQDALASYGLALKNLYPTSQAYLEYRDFIARRQSR